MSDEPWLTDPKYGGMSPQAARASYEAWLREGGPNRKASPVVKVGNEPQHALDLRRRQLQAMLEEYELELAAYDTWMKAWEARQQNRFPPGREARKAQK